MNVLPYELQYELVSYLPFSQRKYMRDILPDIYNRKIQREHTTGALHKLYDNFCIDYCENDTNSNRQKEVYSIFACMNNCEETKELYSKDELFRMIEELSGSLC
jgi:hypothetical protein